jgi:hypothetical protein
LKERKKIRQIETRAFDVDLNINFANHFRKLNTVKDTMTSHGLRGTTLTTMRSNTENEPIGPRGKTMAGGADMALKGRLTRTTRAAMTDIGNKTNILQNIKNPTNKGT